MNIFLCWYNFIYLFDDKDRFFFTMKLNLVYLVENKFDLTVNLKTIQFIMILTGRETLFSTQSRSPTGSGTTIGKIHLNLMDF